MRIQLILPGHRCRDPLHDRGVGRGVLLAAVDHHRRHDETECADAEQRPDLRRHRDGQRRRTAQGGIGKPRGHQRRDEQHSPQHELEAGKADAVAIVDEDAVGALLHRIPYIGKQRNEHADRDQPGRGPAKAVAPLRRAAEQHVDKNDDQDRADQNTKSLEFHCPLRWTRGATIGRRHVASRSAAGTSGIGISVAGDRNACHRPDFSGTSWPRTAALSFEAGACVKSAGVRAVRLRQTILLASAEKGAAGCWRSIGMPAAKTSMGEACTILAKRNPQMQRSIASVILP